MYCEALTKIICCALNILFSYAIRIVQCKWKHLYAYLSIKLKWRQKWRTDVSAVLLDSYYLLSMKTKINILHQKHVLASNKSIKIMQPCCTLLMTNSVSFNNLTARFTALYQAYWAENYWKKNRIWYA